VEEIGEGLNEANALRVLDATGMIVTPGFVDLHAHVAFNVVRLCIDPQINCLMRGTTTVADAGSCGELNFAPFKEYVIRKGQARILAFINIESLGMVEFVDSALGNSDQKWSKLLQSRETSKLFATPENTKKIVQENRKDIVGIKWAHHTLELLKIARKTADDAKCLVMAESRLLPTSLKYLSRGDIATHIFHFAKHRVTKKHDGITTDGRRIHPEVFTAHKRGVVFDVGHGKGSFSWKVARLALKEGLEPDTISTDLWSGNVTGPVYDLPTTMAKFLHLGMTLERVVEAVTSKPASVLGRDGEFGTLKPGAPADLVVFKLHQEKKVLTDSYGNSEVGNRVIVPVYVIKNGNVVINAA
jgi:dihydroorotase